MSLGKGLLTAGILVCTTVLARAGGPYLINAQQADFRSRPEYVRDHLAHIESLPFDGVVFTSTTTAVLMNGTARSYEEIAQEFAPLHGLSFTRIKHNLAWVNVDRPADFFGDWTVTIENFRILARVLRENGIAGIFFDNEEYLRRLFNYPDNCDDATKSLAQYRAQARLRGREIGEALANEFPEIVLMVLHGPYSSFAGTPEEVHRGQTEWDTEELRGPFSIGLLEGLDSRAEFVDGGAVYAYRAAADFQVSYDYRKFELASDGSDCPFISPELRHVWPRKVGIAFGVYNHSFAGVPMDATIMRTTLAAALQRCDEFVWLYSEGINWNAPGEIAPEWVDAVLAAKGPQAFVSITSPGTGGTFVNPASISIKATASRAGGEISKVEFFDGATKLGVTSANPFSFEWLSPPPGIHTVIANAIHDGGLTTASSAVQIRVSASFSANINFQTASVTAPIGYFADVGQVYAGRGNGLTYGWNVSHVQNTRDAAGSTDLRLDTLCQVQSEGTWEIAVPAGSYRVTVGIGDGLNASTHTVNVEGQNYWSAQTLAAGEYVTKTKTVAVSDGRLTLDVGDAAYEATRLTYLIIAAEDAPPRAPRGLSAVPIGSDAVDLAWTDNSSNEEAFTLERSTDKAFSSVVQIASVGAEQTTYRDRTVSAGHTYYYRLAADAQSGRSDYSNLTTAAPPLPDTDSDGIADALEVFPAIVGIDDRIADKDGDGASNSAEYIAGTDSLDASSHPGITAVTRAISAQAETIATLCFPTVSNREYLVDYSARPSGGIWTLVPNATTLGTGNTECRSDSFADPVRFYRLRVAH